MKTHLLVRQQPRDSGGDRPAESQRRGRAPTAVQAQPDAASPLVQLTRAEALGHTLGGFTVQPALAIGEPGDQYEQEADAIAAQAVQHQPAQRSTEPPEVQRIATAPESAAPEPVAPEPVAPEPVAPEAADSAAPADVGTDTAVPDLGDMAAPTEVIGEMGGANADLAAGDSAGAMDLPTEQPDEAVETPAIVSDLGDDLGGETGEGETGAPGSIEARIQAEMASGGTSLPEETQSWLRSRLGIANPEEIVIHDNSAAHGLCEALAALAFTTSNHIFFAEGEYDPDSDAGRELLAHEAVHTIQQGATEGGAEPETPPTSADPADASAAGLDHLDGDGDLGTLDSVVQAQPALLQRDDETQTSEAAADQVTAPEPADAEAAGLENPNDTVAADAADPEVVDPAAIGATPQFPEHTPDAIAIPDIGTPIDRPDLGDLDSIDADATSEGDEILASMGLVGSLEAAGLSEAFWQETTADQVLVQREADDSSGTLSHLLASDYSEQPDWAKLKGDDFGTQLVQNLIVSQSIGQVYEVGATFASLADETNAFGVMAVVLEGFCQILELITDILNIICLVLTVAGTLMAAVGWVLSLFPWTAAWGAILTAKAIEFLNLAGQLYVKVIEITILRLQWRAISVLFRIASVLYEGGSWDDLWSEIKAQVIDMAVDALTVIAGKIFGFATYTPYSASATSMLGLSASVAAQNTLWVAYYVSLGSVTSSAWLDWIENAGIDIGQWFAGAYEDTSGALAQLSVAQLSEDPSGTQAQMTLAQRDTEMMTQLEERQEDYAGPTAAEDPVFDADLPMLPEEAPGEVSEASGDAAFFAFGSGVLSLAELELLNAIAGRQSHAAQLYNYQTNLAQSEASVQGATDVLAAQNALNEEAIAVAGEAGSQSNSLGGDMQDVSSDLKDKQGAIQAGAQDGESQGADASGAQGAADVQKGVDAGPSAATDADQGAAAGSQAATAVCQDNDKKMAEADQLTQQVGGVQGELAKAQGDNSAEIEQLFAQLAEVRDEQDSVQASREAAMERREAAIEAIAAWTEEHRDAVEAFFLDLDSEETDGEVDPDDRDDAEDGTEEETGEAGDQDLLAAFYEWLDLVAEPMYSDMAAMEEEQTASAA